MVKRTPTIASIEGYYASGSFNWTKYAKKGDMVILAANEYSLNTDNLTLQGSFPYALADGNVAQSKIFLVNTDGNFSISGAVYNYPIDLGIIHFG